MQLDTPHAAGGAFAHCCLELPNYADDGNDRAMPGGKRVQVASARLWEYGCKKVRAGTSYERRESARRVDLSYGAYRARLGECPCLRLQRPVRAEKSRQNRVLDAEIEAMTPDITILGVDKSNVTIL